MRFGHGRRSNPARGAGAGGYVASGTRRSAHLVGRRVLVVVGCVMAVASIWSWSDGRDRRHDAVATHAREAAEALRSGRAAGGERLAPSTMGLAADAYAAGLRLSRREDLRWGWLRDYGPATEAFGEAISLAETSVVVASRGQARAHREGMGHVRAATAELEALHGIESLVWMSREQRRQLQTARSLLSSADALIASGAHEAGRARAREARALTQPLRAAVHGATARFVDAESLAQWRRWIDETVAWSQRTGRVAIVVLKDEHEVHVYDGGRLRHRFRGELGWNNVADKVRRGDGATPEGRYFVTQKKGVGASRYHRALLVDYPNKEDLTRLSRLTRTGVLPSGTDAGGLIEIHGEGGRGRDWTDGCVAITNAEMDSLFALVSVGTPVTIVGSRSGSGIFATVARSLAP